MQSVNLEKTMINNKKISLLLFCIISINVFAQTVITDSVFLTNGNIITGQIKQYVPNEYLKISTKDGLFFFLTSDISKLAIHTNNLNDLISKENLQNKDVVTPSDNINDDVYIKIQHPDVVKFTPVDRSKYNDYIPVNLFFMQSSLEISSISTPFTVYGQAKFQAIYARRFIPDYAFGLGACLRYVDFDSFAKVLFFDIRTMRVKGNRFASFSCDPGIVFYDGSVGLNFNLAYNYAMRIDKNLFFTIGVDLNYQSNRYREYSTQNGYYYYISRRSGSKNPGIVIGLVF